MRRQQQQQSEYLLLLFLGMITLISGGITAFNRGMKSFQSGDVEILLNETYWRCDKILCPQATYRCHVEKDKTSATNLERKNICYAKDDTILLEDTTNEVVKANEKIKLKVDVYHNGVTSAYESVNFVSNSAWNIDGDFNDFSALNKQFSFDLSQLDDIEEMGQEEEENILDINDAIEDEMDDVNREIFSIFDRYAT